MERDIGNIVKGNGEIGEETLSEFTESEQNILLNIPKDEGTSTGVFNRLSKIIVDACNGLPSGADAIDTIINQIPDIFKNSNPEDKDSPSYKLINALLEIVDHKDITRIGKEHAVRLAFDVYKATGTDRDHAKHIFDKIVQKTIDLDIKLWN